MASKGAAAYATATDFTPEVNTFGVLFILQTKQLWNGCVMAVKLQNLPQRCRLEKREQSVCGSGA